MYAELTARTAFSFGDGAVTPEQLVSHAHALGYRSIGITDASDFGGIAKAKAKIEADGLDLRLVVGAELNVDGYPVVLLVKNQEGCRNLSSLITRSRVGHLDGWLPVTQQLSRRGRPGITFDDLRERCKGLYVLTGGGAGKINNALVEDRVSDVNQLLQVWSEYFGDNLIVQVEDHLTGGIERAVSGKLVHIAEDMGLRWVVTNSPRYIDDNSRLVHDILIALRNKMTLDEAEHAGVLHPNGMWKLRSPEDMFEAWQHNPKGIYESAIIADSCEFELSWLRPPLPKFDVKNCVSAGSNNLLNDSPLHNSLDYSLDSESQFLRTQVYAGARKRWGSVSSKQKEQLEKELKVINKLGFAGFFLVMWDAVRHAREELRVLCQGRGSAASSAVAYCLEITAVDPIAHHLMFERFLSDVRVPGTAQNAATEAPDIDLDIEHDKREEVLNYIYEKYKRVGAAITCIVQTYGAPNALLDSMRALGYPVDLASKLSKRMHRYDPAGGAAALQHGLAEQFGLELNSSRGRALLRAMDGFNDLPRLRSTHVGGFVLSDLSLSEYLPVESTSMGRTIIQFDKDDLDTIGVPKFDFLGLGALAMVKHAFNEVKHRTGQTLELYNLPQDDPQTFEMIRNGDTLGTFQIESRAQISSLVHTKPEEMYDLVVQIALVRPGPIQGDFIKPYVGRRQGREPVSYIHPKLEPILKRTYGIPIFQEQAMAIASALGNISQADTDRLRRSMGNRKNQERLRIALEQLKLEMLNNPLQPPVTIEMAEQIIKDLSTFSNYGFPESHAWSFAYIAYATTYLKCHYPTEFYVGLLNSQPIGFYPVSTLIHDAIKHGVVVLPPCISDGDVLCKTVFEDDGSKPRLQVGLKFLRGVKAETIERIVRLRSLAPYTSIADVVQRGNLKKSEVLQIAKSGAFSVWEADRRKAAWEALRAAGDRMPFAPTYGSDGYNPRPLTRSERIYMDYYSTGICIDGHPVEHLRDRLYKLGAVDSAGLKRSAHGTSIVIGGLVTIRQRPQSANGTTFLLLEDERGLFNVVVAPALVEKYREAVKFAPFLVVKGRVQKFGRSINVVADKVVEVRVEEDLIHHVRSFR